MMAEFFVGLQKGVFSSHFLCRVHLFGEFFSFLQERATPVCLTEKTCVGVQPFISTVSIPFDLRHPWEAWADLPQGNLVV